MEKFYKRSMGLTLMMLLAATIAYAQTTISGVVKDKDGSIAGVNIVVKGTVAGTNSNIRGEFNLTVNQPTPLTLVFSFIGYKSLEIEITDSNTSGLEIVLEEDRGLLGEVVVRGTFVEESILQSGRTIEKMDTRAIQSTASDNYYKGLINLKGLDMTTSSVNFQIINARGFNSTGNTRFVQLTDGMDTQAPALNFPIGNLNGPSELDVESVEFLPGTASALYGPNAFNGILLVNSKSPFEYQGLSAFAKYSFNHIGDSDLNSEGRGKIGPGSSQPMYEAAIRYAKAFNNKFAFKLAFSYSQATDWYGTNFRDKAIGRTPDGFSFNPGSDRVHAFGDEVATQLGLVGISLGNSPTFMASPLAPLLPFLPDHIVSRTPYEEEHLVDYNAKNLKASVGLHYRITDKMELLYNLNYGSGTSVYTGAQRYSLKNFYIQQHKLELKGDNFFIRGYTTMENSGDSYIADLTGVLINSAWKGNSQWFQEYSLGYLTYIGTQLTTTPGFNPNATASQEAAHNFARGAADTGRYLPGTTEFKNAKANATSAVIPNGSLFADDTRLYHGEVQYNFKKQINPESLELITGASYRLYDLNSNGTIFADTAGNDITIQEVGAFVQAAKTVFDNKLKLTGSLRYDKNENFDAQINPRISGVVALSPNSNIRVSYQTGFRNPTTQGQHIDLNVVSARLLGGLPQYAAARNIYQYAYDLRSVEQFVAQVSAAGSSTALGNPTLLNQLVPVTNVDPVGPEKVQAIEIGYKGLIGDRLFIDLAYYYNAYQDFIVQQFMRKAGGIINTQGVTEANYLIHPNTEQNIRNAQTLLTPITTPGQENTFSVYTNLNKRISAQGFVFGAEYVLGTRGYKFGFNYNWNKLNEELGGGYLSEFNTPEHKFNLTFGNRKVTDNLGFNVAYRWQDEFLWESSFAQGIVPAAGIVDAQVSYKVKGMKSIFKLGGSNLFNDRYVLNYGGPTLGAIYYFSITFDQLMN
jgi:outer membrane receptor protein involved in Fe transport